MAYNVLALGEEADFRSTKLSANTELDTLPDCVIQAGKYNPDSYRDHLSTEPAFLPNACYSQCFVFSSLLCLE